MVDSVTLHVHVHCKLTISLARNVWVCKHSELTVEIGAVYWAHLENSEIILFSFPGIARGVIMLHEGLSRLYL